MRNAWDSGKHCGVAPGSRWRARARHPLGQALTGTPVDPKPLQMVFGILSVETRNIPPKASEISGRAASCIRWGGSIRKNIIGHGLQSLIPHSVAGRGVRGGRRTLALLEQQTRQHGNGVLFEPLIEQSSNLFAKVRGMTQTRKLETLQGIAGSGQKKLPRRGHSGSGHRSPPRDEMVCIITRQ